MGWADRLGRDGLVAQMLQRPPHPAARRGLEPDRPGVMGVANVAPVGQDPVLNAYDDYWRGLTLANTDDGAAMLQFDDAVTGRDAAKLLREIKGDVNAVIPDATLQRGRSNSGYVDQAENLALANAGEGRATTLVLSYLDQLRNQAPGMYDKLLSGTGVPIDTIATSQTGHLAPVRRELFPGEDEYFKKNPHVSGMAAEDNKVILNPYSNLSADEFAAVIMNEQARIFMRSGMTPKFKLTQEQEKTFSGYSSNEQDILETVAARLLSGDPSAGAPTPEQQAFVQELRHAMYPATQ